MKNISIENTNRWFLIQTQENGEENIYKFGYLDPQNNLVTPKPILLDFLTEEELESKVNEVTGDNEYYKNSVENNSSKFRGPSGIYETNTIEQGKL